MPARREDRVREPRYRDERRRLDRRYLDERTGRPAPVYRPRYRHEKDRPLYPGDKVPPSHFRAYLSGEKDNKAYLSGEKENRPYHSGEKAHHSVDKTYQSVDKTHHSGEKENKDYVPNDKESKAFPSGEREKFAPPPSGRATPNINAWLNEDKDAIRRPEEHSRSDPRLHPYYAPDEGYEADFHRISSPRGRYDSAESLERIYTPPKAEEPEGMFQPSFRARSRIV